MTMHNEILEAGQKIFMKERTIVGMIIRFGTLLEEVEHYSDNISYWSVRYEDGIKDVRRFCKLDKELCT